MKVVIQCAGSKNEEAGCLRSSDGRIVHIVAHPELREEQAGVIFAHPDGPSPAGGSWRDQVLEYNQDPGDNPCGLVPAYQLYSESVYRELADATEQFFVLSAGWGLIVADFLTPCYDVTFKSGVHPSVRRGREDTFNDLCMLDLDRSEPLVFVGGKDYLWFFGTLTEGYRGPRVALFTTAAVPSWPGVKSVRYGEPYTNWHYGAARDLLAGRLDLTL